MMYEDLNGKNIVVTGGASGIGLATAGAFAANRAHVIIVGRNATKLAHAEKTLGGDVHALPFDLNELERLPELARAIRDRMGEVDVLVNNAGVNLKKDALRVTTAEYMEIVQTNQTAVFALTRELARPMIRRGTGSIIMISSMASRYGIPKVVGYTAAKAAVEGMTRALAVEWSPFGVRVNCIAPGFILTEMSAKALQDDPDRHGRVLARTPMGRLGEPSDIANAVLFLASEQSRYVTGIVLPVDGGNSIGF